jgi:hypothetical protein
MIEGWLDVVAANEKDYERNNETEMTKEDGQD